MYFLCVLDARVNVCVYTRVCIECLPMYPGVSEYTWFPGQGLRV